LEYFQLKVSAIYAKSAGMYERLVIFHAKEPLKFLVAAKSNSANRDNFEVAWN
jgi:hypothetical protein